MQYKHPTHDSRYVLTVLTMLHTLHITTILTLPMLLIWHISTACLVEHFNMPEVWKKRFTKPQLEGWRAATWVLVFALVLVDLGHASWCLGRVHARMHLGGGEVWGQGNGDNEDIGQGGEKREGSLRRVSEKMCGWRMWMVREASNDKYDDDANTAGTSTPTMSATSPPVAPSRKTHPQSSKHSASSSHRSLCSLFAHTAFHILAITLYTTHILSYATSLQPSFNTCNFSMLHREWESYTFLYQKQKLSFRDRCVRINWSIWVAGGFSCAGALIMGLLHLVTFGARVWEHVQRHLELSEEGGGGQENWTGDSAGDEKEWAVRPRDVEVKPRGVQKSTIGARSSSAMSRISQGESGLRRRGDFKASSKAKSKSESESESKSKSKSEDETWRADAAWNEALLECLVP